jgi:hypothetical protein
MKKRFIDLLSGNADIHPVKQQSLAGTLFPEVLRNSNLLPWRHAIEPMQGLRVVIGIAANYSLPDLEFLDAIDEVLRQDVAYRGAIEVFNALETSQMEDFEKYIPGITPVVQTPVAGSWAAVG